jgi:hypothetical protein
MKLLISKNEAITKLEERKKELLETEFIEIDPWFHKIFFDLDSIYSDSKKHRQKIYDFKIGYGYNSSGGSKLIDSFIYEIKNLPESNIKEEYNNLVEENKNLKIKLVHLQSSSSSGNSTYGEKKAKTQLPFGISSTLFWSIFAGTITGIFFLGNEIGKSRFDKEKIDNYNQLQILQRDTFELHKIIISKEDVIKEKDSEISIKADSLTLLTKDIGNLYFLLGEYKDGKK